jgi:hypothetical protein
MPEVPTIEHTFSVEMTSKHHVKTLSISNQAYDRVLFEGNLGELQELSLVEGSVLEFVGTNGVLRLEISADQLQIALRKHHHNAHRGSEVGSITNTIKHKDVKK